MLPLALSAALGIGGGALSSFFGNDKQSIDYVDPRSPEQIAMLKKLLGITDNQLETGTSFTPQQRQVMLAEILGGANKGYDATVRDIDNSSIDPRGRKYMKSRASRDRASAIAGGHQQLNLQDALGFKDTLNRASNLSTWTPQMQARPNFNPASGASNFLSGVGDVASYFGGKAIQGYGAEKGWWS